MGVHGWGGVAARQAVGAEVRKGEVERLARGGGVDGADDCVLGDGGERAEVAQISGLAHGTRRRRGGAGVLWAARTADATLLRRGRVTLARRLLAAPRSSSWLTQRQRGERHAFRARAQSTQREATAAYSLNVHSRVLSLWSRVSSCEPHLLEAPGSLHPLRLELASLRGKKPLVHLGSNSRRERVTDARGHLVESMGLCRRRPRGLDSSASMSYAARCVTYQIEPSK